MIHYLFRLLIAPAVFNPVKEGELLQRFFSGKDSGVFVDVGANTPESAVTLPFLKAGWAGVAVDPIPSNAESLRDSGYEVWCGAVTSETQAKQGFMSFYVAGGESGRKSSLDHEKIDPALDRHQIEVALTTLRDLFERYELARVDLLSVDVEGCEGDVLSTINSTDVSGLLLVEDWARDTTLHNLIVSKGYKRVRRTGYNSWYVPKASKFPVSIWGRLHLFCKLNIFCIVRRRRFQRRLNAYG